MALTITINITDAEEACLKNDLLDVDDWVRKAVVGKINNCRKRFIREWTPKMFADPEVDMIPADDAAFIASVLARPDYKNRVAREAR